MGTSSLQDLKSKKFAVALIAEFMGTALLVLVACGSCLAPEPLDLSAKVVRISLAFGLSVATIVWAIGNVSGGHINPAVTIAFFVTRKISIVRFLLYVGFQILGALVGAALLRGLTPDELHGTLCTSDTSLGLSEGQVFGVELFITFVFVFTILAAVDGNRKDIGGSVPLTIGLALAMCHLWAAPASGSGMNPARVFGPAVVSHHWHNHWCYWVGPLVGGAVAGILYDFVFAVNATPAKLKGFFTRDYDDDDYDQTGRRSSVHVISYPEETDDNCSCSHVHGSARKHNKYTYHRVHDTLIRPKKISLLLHCDHDEATE